MASRHRHVTLVATCLNTAARCVEKHLAAGGDAAVLSHYVLATTPPRRRITAAIGVAAVVATALLAAGPVSAAGPIDDLGTEPSWHWHTEYDASWRTGSPVGVADPSDRRRPAPRSTVVLGAGEYLSVGQSVGSPNGWYRLTLEPDGRLVLRDTDDGLGLHGTLWTSGPVAATTPLLVMRTTGELALYDAASPGFPDDSSDGKSAKLWSTGTRSATGAVLGLGDDGALSVVAPDGRTLWHSGNKAPDVGLAGSPHVIYDRGGQWVWLIDADGSVVDNYPVSGHAESPLPGRYAITSKSEDAISYNWLVTMEHMVRFTTDEEGDWIGFHSIPRGWRDTPVQSEAELGDTLSLGCVRQRDDKAEQLYAWTSIGTPVIVLA